MPVYAGTRITASGINNIAGLYAPKTSDQSLASNTTLQNDTALFVTLAANTSYDFALRLIYQGAATGTGDLKWGYTVPAGTTFNAYSVTIANPLGVAVQFNNQSTVQFTATNGTGAPLAAWVEGFLTTSSTPGTFQITWAQNSSNATATTVKIGSRLIAWNANYL